MTPQEQADALLTEFLAWSQAKHAQDQKRLKSILEAWALAKEKNGQPIVGNA